MFSSEPEDSRQLAPIDVGRTTLSAAQGSRVNVRSIVLLVLCLFPLHLSAKCPEWKPDIKFDLAAAQDASGKVTEPVTANCGRPLTLRPSRALR